MSVKLYFESCKKCKRAGSTTAEGKCYHCGADYTTELNMPSAPGAMTPAQIAMQTRRLFLEEQIQTSQHYLFDLMRKCTHFVIKTEHGGAFCDVCGQDFGWWCSKSPTHYCEYDQSDPYGCKWCHEPEERK